MRKHEPTDRIVKLKKIKNMETNYDVDYFIRKFSAIPYALWGVGDWGHIDKGEPTCATGHCGYDNHRYCLPTIENIALIGLFSNVILHDNQDGNIIVDDKREFSWKVVRVNDGMVKEYQQPTPKQRILAALYDIKAMQTKDTILGQQPKHTDITASLAVLPVDETSDLIQQLKTV